MTRDAVAGAPADVLVLGGGYVGVWSARRILRATGAQRRAGRVRITMVASSPAHAFHGWTAEVITGHVGLRRSRTLLTTMLPGVRLISGSVESVDLDRQRVTVATPDWVGTVPYDHLVIGVGSRDAVDPIPGLAAHGWTVKGDDALARLCGRLAEVVLLATASSDPAERERLLTVVVAGGGFAGAEVSAAIMQRLRGAVAAVPVLAGTRPRVILLHSGSRLMPSLRPRFDGVADYCVAQVRQAGVEVRYGVRLTEVTRGAAIIADSADRSAGGDLSLPAATVVAALGQSPVPLPGTEELPRDRSGRLLTDRYLRVRPGVWAGGDVAAVPHPSGSGPCPSNALWAIYHGKRLGSNVARALGGRPARPFRFPGLGQAASFGVGRGAGELYGVALRGWTAWLARWVVFHFFMPSRRSALLTAAEWFVRSPENPAADAVGVRSSLIGARDEGERLPTRAFLGRR